MTKKLDIDDIRLMQDLMRGQSNTQTAVPTVQVQKDSFDSFTGGLSKGWPFILAMVSIAFWVVQAIFGITSTQEQHDARITRNTTAIASIEEKLDQASTQSNEIIRRLDNLQKDMETIKAK